MILMIKNVPKIVALMKSGDWRAVLSLYDAPSRYHEPLLVWVRPSSAMLQFIEDQGDKERKKEFSAERLD